MIANLFIFLIGVLRIFTAVAASAFLCVLVHELGHAIPALLLSKEKVEAYIGSLGLIVPSGKLRMGRLTIFVSYNPFLWIKGMCKPYGAYSINRQIFYVSTGPIATIGLGVLAYQLLAITEPERFAKWCLILVLIFSIWFAVVSIIPAKFRQAHGDIIGNDAYSIIQLLKAKRLPNEIFAISPLVQEGKFEEAIQLFEGEVKGVSGSADEYRVGVWMYMHARDFQKALEMDQKLEKKVKYNVQDFVNSGYIQTMLGNQQSAINIYKKALALDPDNMQALGNISYGMVVLGQYDEAIEYANKAITLNPNCAASLDNRGLARLKMGLLEEGRADIEASLTIDDNQSETYRNLGIYFLMKKQWNEALALFEKAKEINKDTSDIDQYITDAKNSAIEAGDIV